MRAGFLAGELPLIGNEYEVRIVERLTLDLERLREVFGEKFLERFRTKPVSYVLVKKIEDSIQDDETSERPRGRDLIGDCRNVLRSRT